MRNGNKSGPLLESDYKKFKKYMKSVSGTIGSTYRGPLSVIIKMQLFWGDSLYPNLATVSSVYYGNQSILLNFTQTGGNAQVLKFNGETLRWQLYELKYN